MLISILCLSRQKVIFKHEKSTVKVHTGQNRVMWHSAAVCPQPFSWPLFEDAIHYQIKDKIAVFPGLHMDINSLK